MTEELSPRQSQILGMLRLSVKERGYPPSVREIGSAVGLSSSSVARQLHELEDKGHIVRDPYKPRALRIVDDPDEEARLQRARAEGWREGHKGCTCQRPGATPCRNPYETEEA